MAKYHDIASDIWEQLVDRTWQEKLVYIFLFSNAFCRPSGLYQISPKTIKFYTGVDEIEWKPLASPLSPLICYDNSTEEVFVRGKLKHFRNIFKNHNILKSIENDLILLKSPFLRGLFLEKYSKDLEGLPSPLRHSHSQSQGLKEIGCGKEKKQKVVENPTRTNPNQPRWEYSPEAQKLVGDALKKLKKF